MGSWCKVFSKKIFFREPHFQDKNLKQLKTIRNSKISVSILLRNANIPSCKLGVNTLARGSLIPKTSGILTMLQTTLKLADNSTLTSDEALNFVNLNLNDYALTLGSSTSDLTIENAITIDSSGEGILTGEADLILLSSLNMSQGLLGSTGGTWVLSKDFLKSGGTLTISQTDLELKDSIKLTSDQALSFVFVTLNLNNFTLTLVPAS